MASPRLSSTDRDNAAAIYDILVERAGAHDDESNRYEFEQSYLETVAGKEIEYRFGGKLGFGGKIWWSRHGGWYVNCYREDESIPRLKIIATVNAALARFNTPAQNAYWT
jgi:hypothetical protein